jgi:ubiquinone biosynthesis protein UbiJ
VKAAASWARRGHVTFDCAAYLHTVLPALLQRAQTPPLGRQVVIQFLVIDRAGCEIFYSIDDEQLRVGQGVSNRVDLTLAFCAADLSAFGDHSLDVARAVRTGRLKVMGDVALVQWLSSRLAARPAA